MKATASLFECSLAIVLMFGGIITLATNMTTSIDVKIRQLEAAKQHLDGAGRASVEAEIERLKGEQKTVVEDSRFILDRITIKATNNLWDDLKVGDTVQVNNGYEVRAGTITEVLIVGKAWRVSCFGRAIVAVHPDQAWE